MNRKLHNIIIIVGLSCLFAGALLTLIYSVCGLVSLLYKVLIGG